MVAQAAVLGAPLQIGPERPVLHGDRLALLGMDAERPRERQQQLRLLERELSGSSSANRGAPRLPVVQVVGAELHVWPVAPALEVDRQPVSGSVPSGWSPCAARREQLERLLQVELVRRVSSGMFARTSPSPACTYGP